MGKNDEYRQEILRKLMRELKSVYDDRDFVCGTLSIAQTTENWLELLDYIEMTREDGEEVSSDNIILLALALHKETIAKNERRGKVAAAML